MTIPATATNDRRKNVGVSVGFSPATLVPRLSSHPSRKPRYGNCAAGRIRRNEDARELTVADESDVSIENGNDRTETPARTNIPEYRVVIPLVRNHQPRILPYWNNAAGRLQRQEDEAARRNGVAHDEACTMARLLENGNEDYNTVLAECGSSVGENQGSDNTPPSPLSSGSQRSIDGHLWRQK
ncbi:hypothetical protein FKW77_002932 [Venturia effusa]|uniref:Uncharacterized protein n=1 Tax=Venturia effusa TaxID=50376 RepID=A0A517L0Z9_9PEZI|nr:hypothetical protein FKW77_002932 [Venturia effusa]